jgi:hypothetical protein
VSRFSLPAVFMPSFAPLDHGGSLARLPVLIVALVM